MVELIDSFTLQVKSLQKTKRVLQTAELQSAAIGCIHKAEVEAMHRANFDAE